MSVRYLPHMMVLLFPVLGISKSQKHPRSSLEALLTPQFLDRALRTAKVWKNYQLAYDLRGHEQSVWAVIALEPDKFLTGMFL